VKPRRPRCVGATNRGVTQESAALLDTPKALLSTLLPVGPRFRLPEELTKYSIGHFSRLICASSGFGGSCRLDRDVMDSVKDPHSSLASPGMSIFLARLAPMTSIPRVPMVPLRSSFTT
jgi:hypothetical protein